MKAKFIDGRCVVIDYDAEIKRINEEYEIALIQNSISDTVIDAILSKNESDRTVEEIKKVTLRDYIDKKKEEKIAQYSDYKDFEVVSYIEDIPEYNVLIPQFEEQETKIVQTYVPQLHKQFVKEGIAEYQKKLSDTDYIVIKQYEATLAGTELPYTTEYLQEVTILRQGYRDKINELKELLETL